MDHHDLSAALERSLDGFYTEYPQCFHPFLWHERETLLSTSGCRSA